MKDNNIKKGRSPYNKSNSKRISLPKLLELITTSCNYQFCIVDDSVDEELIAIAAKKNIDLKGFKHVIETSGAQHCQKRHGVISDDRNPLSIGDYLMIPYIIKERDHVELSPQKDQSHRNMVFIYTKQIGDIYYYVEEIRKRNKSLAFKTMWKRSNKSPSK